MQSIIIIPDFHSLQYYEYPNGELPHLQCTLQNQLFFCHIQLDHKGCKKRKVNLPF